MHKPRVLFHCTGNSARNQMAEAYLRAYAGDHFEIHSAEQEPKGHTLHCLNERGIQPAQQ